MGPTPRDESNPRARIVRRFRCCIAATSRCSALPDRVVVCAGPATDHERTTSAWDRMSSHFRPQARRRSRSGIRLRLRHHTSLGPGDLPRRPVTGPRRSRSDPAPLFTSERRIVEPCTEPTPAKPPPPSSGPARWPSCSPTSQGAPGSGRTSRRRWPTPWPRHDAILRDGDRVGRRHRGQDDRRRADGGLPDGRRGRRREPRRPARPDRRPTGARPARSTSGWRIHAGDAERRGTDYFGPTINRTARLMAVGHGGQVLLSAAAAALCADGLPAGASLRDLGEFRLKDLGRPERVFQLVHPDLESTFPPLMTIDHGAASLPIPTTAFVGRRAELEAVERYLEDPAIRLLTLTGPGGTGKTSLAIRAAGDQSTRFRDGVSFVDVSACRDADGLILGARSRRRRGRGPRPLDPRGAGRAPARAPGPAGARQLRAGHVRRLGDDRAARRVRPGQAAGHQPRAAPRPDRARLPGPAARPAARDPSPRLGRGGRRASSRSSCSSTGRAPSGPTSRSPTTTRRRSSRSAAGSTGSRSRSSSRRLVSASSRPRRCAIAWAAASSSCAARRATSPSASRRCGPRSTGATRSSSPPSSGCSRACRSSPTRTSRAIEAVAAAAGRRRGRRRASTDDGAGDVIESLASLIEKSLVRQVDAGGGEPRVRMLETIREFATEQLDQAPRSGRRPPRPRRLLRRPRRRAPPRPVGRRPGPGDGRDDDRGRELPDRAALLGRAGRRRRADEARQQPPDPQRGAWLVPRHGRAGVRHARDPDSHGEHARARRQGDRAPVDARPRAHGDAGVHARGRRGVHADARSVRARPGIRPALFRPAFAGEPVRAALRVRQGGRDRRADPGDGRGRGRPRHVDRRASSGWARPWRSPVDCGRASRISTRPSACSRRAPTRRSGRALGNDSRVACYTTSAFTLWTLGLPDRAVERADAAIALSDRLGHPWTSAFARSTPGLLHLWRREPELVLDRAIRLIEIADEYDFRIWSAIGSCLLGAAQVRIGQVDAGLAALRTGMTGYQGMVAPPVFWPMLLVVDAGSRGEAGRPAEGLPLVASAIEMTGGPESPALIMAELLVLQGDLHAGARLGRRGARLVATGARGVAPDRGPHAPAACADPARGRGSRIRASGRSSTSCGPSTRHSPRASRPPTCARLPRRWPSQADRTRSSVRPRARPGSRLHPRHISVGPDQHGGWSRDHPECRELPRTDVPRRR